MIDPKKGVSNLSTEKREKLELLLVSATTRNLVLQEHEEQTLVWCYCTDKTHVYNGIKTRGNAK